MPTDYKALHEQDLIRRAVNEAAARHPGALVRHLTNELAPSGRVIDDVVMIDTPNGLLTPADAVERLAIDPQHRPLFGKAPSPALDDAPPMDPALYREWRRAHPTRR